MLCSPGKSPGSNRDKQWLQKTEWLRLVWNEVACQPAQGALLPLVFWNSTQSTQINDLWSCLKIAMQTGIRCMATLMLPLGHCKALSPSKPLCTSFSGLVGVPWRRRPDRMNIASSNLLVLMDWRVGNWLLAICFEIPSSLFSVLHILRASCRLTALPEMANEVISRMSEWETGKSQGDCPQVSILGNHPNSHAFSVALAGSGIYYGSKKSPTVPAQSRQK